MSDEDRKPGIGDSDHALQGRDDATAASVPDADPGLEPLTLSLLGRFFGVPLLIISFIVSGAVLVVFLFGGPATERTRSVESLLQTLEASSGEKSMGMLLPREKELWQAALELAQRLSNKGTELTEAEVESVASRLASMVERDIAVFDAADFSGREDAAQRRVRSNRLRFMIHALGRTESPVAIGPLLGIVRDNKEPFVAAALRELGETPQLRGNQSAIDAVVSALQSSDRSETLLVGCPVLSILAPPGDAAAIDVLGSVRFRFEGEVNWAASLALARLGSEKGKSTLMDLLDRSFLESSELYTAVDEDGNVVGRYPLPPERIDATLIAAMQAASNLDDPELWEMIGALQSDPSLAVRGKAAEIVSDRT